MNKTIDDADLNQRQLYLQTLSESIKAGSVLAVRYFIRHLGQEHCLSELESAAVDRARSWLASAEAYEAKHGKGRMLNFEHPFNFDRRPQPPIKYGQN